MSDLWIAGEKDILVFSGSDRCQSGLLTDGGVRGGHLGARSLFWRGGIPMHPWMMR